jgi:hypothetical protein
LRLGPDNAKALRMGKEPKPSREERLAAKLRENLRRRKDQAREVKAALPKEKPNS